MPTLIRPQTFETNSSSSHSFVESALGTQQTLAANRIDDAGIRYIGVALGQYGWEFEEYTTPLEKLSYLATLADALNNEDAMERLHRTVREVTGLDFKIESPSDYYSYVDHAEDYSHFLDADLETIIFNSASTIHTGNDNV